MQEVRVGDVYRHFKGEKVGVLEIKDGKVVYVDLETGKKDSKTYVDFVGTACTGSKRFDFLWHEDLKF